MGSGSSLPLHEMDSPKNPGNPSIVSDEIPHNYDVWCDETMVQMRYPVAPMMEAVLLEVKVEDKGKDEIEVMVILDNKKLQSYGYANPQEPHLNRVAQHNKIKMNRAERWIATESMKPRWESEEPELAVKTHCDFLTDPFRIDYYWTLPDGTRKADGATLGAAQPVVNSVMQALGERKVSLSINEAKGVIGSGPIGDDVATYDAFFDGLIYMLKEGNPFKPVIEDLTERKFRCSSAAEGEFPVVYISFDKDKGVVTQETYNSDESKKLYVNYISVSQQPMVMEIYGVGAEGERRVGPGMLKAMQALIDGAVAKANSGWGLGFF